MHRMYENEDIVIFWDSEKCRHAKMCVHGSPKTFDITRRPWIDPHQAENAEIWQTIEQCPTGALGISYRHGIDVVLDAEGRRSIARDGDRQIGECDWIETGQGRNICHTEVLPEYGGKGIAKRLVYKVLEDAEKSKADICATCSYARKIMEG